MNQLLQWMKKPLLTSGLFAALVVGVAMQSALASEKEVAVALVNEASQAVLASKEQGLKAVQDGKFVKGEVYVFAYDGGATMLAHPKNPKLVGKNLADQPDAEGKLFRREISDVARTKGSGWVDYVYKNPVSSALEQKTTYVKKAGDVVLCAGIYR